MSVNDDLNCMVSLAVLFYSKQGMIVGLGIIFILNFSSAVMNNLKANFWKPYIKQIAYITAFIDVMVFAGILKIAGTSPFLLCMIVFTLGRLLGVYFSYIFEHRMASGMLEISFYRSLEEGSKIADYLRGKNYSVSTLTRYGVSEKEAMFIRVVFPRRKINKLHKILSNQGKGQ